MKYIILEADVNDADFITEVTMIDDQGISKLKEIIQKLLPYRSKVRYDKGIEYRNGDFADEGNTSEFYINNGILTQEEVNFLEELLPYGDDNCPGIHTISKVQVFEKLEDILNYQS